MREGSVRKPPRHRIDKLFFDSAFKVWVYA
jgi:hypothetical protein